MRREQQAKNSTPVVEGLGIKSGNACFDHIKAFEAQNNTPYWPAVKCAHVTRFFSLFWKSTRIKST